MMPVLFLCSEAKHGNDAEIDEEEQDPEDEGDIVAGGFCGTYYEINGDKEEGHPAELLNVDAVVPAFVFIEGVKNHVEDQGGNAGEGRGGDVGDETDQEPGDEQGDHGHAEEPLITGLACGGSCGGGLGNLGGCVGIFGVMGGGESGTAGGAEGGFVGVEGAALVAVHGGIILSFEYLLKFWEIF